VVSDVEPPWKQRPDLPRHSIGWRMGPGEDVYNEYYKWFSALDPAAQQAYRNDHPESYGWRGFYQIIIDHPWRS
jgi:hypothetical protein